MIKFEKNLSKKKIYANNIQMPYKRRQRRRRKPLPWYKRKYTAAEMAGKALSGVNKLRKLVNVEMKKHDRYDTHTVTTNPEEFGLCYLPEGSGENQRNGTSIKLQSLYMRAKLTIHPSATYSLCRLVLVQDKQQISDTTSPWEACFSTNDILSPTNRELNQGRFTILYDEVIRLDTSKLNFFVKKYIPIGNHVKYNGAAGSDIQKNGLYLMCISDEVTNGPSLTHYTRITYTDN